MKDLEIKTLETTGIEEILGCFNNSFSSYKTPINLALSQLQNKIMSENILMEYSLGAFEGNSLIGFILHGYDVINNNKILYNAATGVMPAYRGKGITDTMYAFGLPAFKSKGITGMQLEVITDNHPAVKIYTRVGFNVNRTLNCYKGEMTLRVKNSGYTIRKLDSGEWDVPEPYWNFESAWQNSVATARRNKENLEAWGAYSGNLLAGYLIYIPDRKRAQLFAVKPDCRRQGVASSLFAHVASVHGNEFTVVNVDAGDDETNSFLHSIGLQDYLMQYEMKSAIK